MHSEDAGVGATVAEQFIAEGCVRLSEYVLLAAASLETDRAELARLTAEQERLQAAFDGENEDAGGLLMRLEALDRLGDRNGTLAAAQFMLSLLFMSVELLPVLMKLLLNFSPPTAYDRLAALRDSGDVEIEEMAQESRKSVAQAKEELLVMAEKERVDRQKEAIMTRRRAALADLAARTQAAQQPPAVAAEASEESRPLFDTGPIRELARNAAIRTVRTVRRRPEDPNPGLSAAGLGPASTVPALCRTSQGSMRWRARSPSAVRVQLVGREADRPPDPQPGAERRIRYRSSRPAPYHVHPGQPVGRPMTTHR